MTAHLGLILAGLLLLAGGGEVLVRASVRLALRLGLPPLVVGLTVVAFGTSAPELAAGLAASLEGAPAIVFGNVLGSNSANLGLILGLVALCCPLSGDAFLARREVPFMLLAGLLPVPLLLDGSIGWWEGMLLVLLLGVFLAWLYRYRRSHPGQAAPSLLPAPSGGRLPVTLLGIAAGTVLLALGAHLLVQGAVALALDLGISQRVVGLTMVAVGTSLPELASSITAALRRQGGLLLGNLIGSCIFNSLAIIGGAALARPLGGRLSEYAPDLAVMTAFGLLVLGLLAGGGRIGRRAGTVLLAGYVLYVVLLLV